MIAKIDTTEALRQFDTIIYETDCILVQRDDLGLELAAEKLVLAQKWVTQTSIAASKPLFI